jgi:hypothetical protein
LEALSEALSEATAVKVSLTGIFNDYPSCKCLSPDLERIRETLESLRELAEIESEAWFTGKNTPAPVLTSENPLERFAAMSLKVADLFNDSVMDFDNVEALQTARNCYEIAEKALRTL